jgi:hypothetical protein
MLQHGEIAFDDVHPSASEGAHGMSEVTTDIESLTTL